MIYELEFPETPPSFNAVGHTGNRWAWTEQVKKWREQIEMALLAGKVPRNSFQTVGAGAGLWFRVNRRRDEGNYRTILEKALGDALVNGGWLPDDTPDHFAFGRVSFRKGDPKTVLVLEGLP